MSANGKSVPIKQWVTNSTHEKSSLTALLTAIYGDGKDFADIDLEPLIGEEAELHLVPNPKGFSRVKDVYPAKRKQKNIVNLHGVEITDDDLPEGFCGETQ